MKLESAHTRHLSNSIITVIIALLIVYFVWLIIPSNVEHSAMSHQHKSLAVRQLSYSPKQAKAKDKSDWKSTKQNASRVMSYDKYMTTKVKCNNNQQLVQVQLKKKYIKALNHASDDNLDNSINTQMHRDASRLKSKTHANQIAIQVMNYNGLIVVDD